MNSEQIVHLCRKHSFFTWSIQNQVQPNGSRPRAPGGLREATFREMTVLSMSSLAS